MCHCIPLHSQPVCSSFLSFFNRFAFVKSSKSIICWTRSLRPLDLSLRSERLPPSLTMRTVIPPTIRAPSPRRQVCASDLLAPAVAVPRGRKWTPNSRMTRTIRRQLLTVSSLLLRRPRRNLTQSPTWSLRLTPKPKSRLRQRPALLQTLQAPVSPTVDYPTIHRV